MMVCACVNHHYCEIAGLSMFSVKITVEVKKFTAVLMLVVFVYLPFSTPEQDVLSSLGFSPG